MKRIDKLAEAFVGKPSSQDQWGKHYRPELEAFKAGYRQALEDVAKILDRNPYANVTLSGKKLLPPTWDVSGFNLIKDEIRTLPDQEEI